MFLEPMAMLEGLVLHIRINFNMLVGFNKKDDNTIYEINIEIVVFADIGIQ